MFVCTIKPITVKFVVSVDRRGAAVCVSSPRAEPAASLLLRRRIVYCHLHRQWPIPNATLQGNQNRYSLTFLHIHWPSWGCWLKVSGAEILMSIAPSSCLLLTANWQHGIKLKKGGRLFFPSLIDSSIEDIFKRESLGVYAPGTKQPHPVSGDREGCTSALIGQRHQSLLNPHRAPPWPVTALTPTSTTPSPLNTPTHRLIRTHLNKHSCTHWTMPALINMTTLDTD